jgi:aspartyl-tRNA(Asn)/glutamyl-tRNA(Gln) amidotransferase subunit C
MGAGAKGNASAGKECPLIPWTHKDQSTKTVPMSEHKISLEDTRHVAKLARLALDESRLQKFTGQLENILKYVDKIAQLDTAGVEPMAHALPLENVLREDVVEPPLTIEQVLQNAPETDGRFFKVPKVIGGDEDSAG